MNIKNKKIYISLLLIIAFISVQIILPLQIAKAEGPDPVGECGISAVTDFLAEGVSSLINAGLGFLGLGGASEQKVDDSKTRANTKKLSFDTCLKALKDAAFKVALAKLKKRLLDRITDDTIQWINDGAKGKPRFIDNFGDVLEESTNEALGDTAREIGLGKLCDEKLSLKLQLNLKKTATKQFRQDASCTLDKIVGNIDDFGKDFRNGGWVGYTETLSPNNNRFGLEILALDRTYQVQTKKDQESQLAASSGGGFKGVEACSYWEIIFENNIGNKSSILKSVYDFSDPDQLRDPNKIFTDTELVNLFGEFVPGSTPVSAICKNKEITMPGQLVKGQAEQALQSDKDVITNADDLSPYISAIFDAAINRLVKSGLEGIGVRQGGAAGGSSILTNSGTGRQPQTYGTSTRDQNYKDYGKEYQTATDMKAKLRDGIKTNMDQIKIQIVELDQTFPGYMDAITQRREKMKYLLQCELQKSDNATVLGMHLPCDSTYTASNSLEKMYNTAVDFQKLITAMKTKVNSPQDLSSFSESDLTTIAGDMSTALEKIKSTRAGMAQDVTKLGELDTKIDLHKSACLAATTYACPQNF